MPRINKFIVGSLLVALMLYPWQIASAHTFGNTGYSQIVVQGRTIAYELSLDSEQLLTFLPIDADGDGVLNVSELSQHDLIRDFVNDFLFVHADGVRGEPQVVKAVEDERNEENLVRFIVRYAFGQEIRKYEIDYRFFFYDIDPDHRNFAAVTAGTANRDKVFTSKDHILRGELEYLQQQEKQAGMNVDHLWTYVVLSTVLAMLLTYSFMRLRIKEIERKQMND